MHSIITKITRCFAPVSRIVALILAVGATSGVWAGKLGEGITAYYEFNLGSSFSGKKWSGDGLVVDDSLAITVSGVSILENGNNAKFGSSNYVLSGGGNNCYVNKVDVNKAYPSTNGNWSMSLWVKRENATSVPCLYHHGPAATYNDSNMVEPAAGANGGLAIYISGAKVKVGFSVTADGSNFSYKTINSFSDYQWSDSLADWHNVIVTRNGTTVSLFVDGVLQGTVPIDASENLALANGSKLSLSKNAPMFKLNSTEDLCLWNRALSQGEVAAIAGGSAPISTLANSEFPVAVSLEECGGFVTTLPQLAFKNATLSEITADTLKGRFGGGSISAKGKAATFFNFASSDSSTLTCEAQMDGDLNSNVEILKSVFLTFTQNGDDVYVSANSVTKWMNKGDNQPGTSLANQGNTGSLATSISASGYGIYNLRLPRTQETDATVVWNVGELLMPKIGADGNKYVITLPASGMSVDANGNLKVASSGATTGATIDLPSEIAKASILIKYSSLAAISDKKVTLSTIKYSTSGAEYVIGARTSNNNVLTLTGYYDDNSENSYPNDNSSYGSGTVPSLPSGFGYFLFAHNADGGTYTYAGYSPYNIAGGSNSRIRWGGKKIGKISIGGPISSKSVSAWPNVEINSVALYVDSIKTASDISNFTFTPTAEATIDVAGTYTLAGDNKLFDSIALDGEYVINVNETATLSIPSATTVNMITFNIAKDKTLTLTGSNGGTLVSRSLVVKGGVLQQGSASVLGATPVLIVKDGGTFDMNGLGIDSSTQVHIAGEGSGNWPWALTSSSGAGGAILGGLYLDDHATIGGANELKIGKSSAAYRCYLQGFTLTKTGAGAFSGTNMNTPGTGTIDVQGGAMSVNQWNNLNNSGGNTTIILRSGTSLNNGTNRTVPMETLKLLGGVLSTDSQAFKMNTSLIGGGETAKLEFASGASASLTDNLTVTSLLKLEGEMSFTKNEDASKDVVVTVSGTLSSSGAISVGSGVTLNLGTNRPTGVITVASDGVLAVKQQNAADVITLSTSAQPENVILYSVNGNEVSNPSVSYASGTLTISLASVDIDTEKTYMVAETLGTPSATSSYEINVTADATLNLGADTAVDILKLNVAEGKTLTITGGKLTADTVVVTGGGNLAFAVADTKTLARNAVAGAPYRVWPYAISSLTGTVSIDDSSVEVPAGYSYRVIDTSKGKALEFTTNRQFGSLNINFPGGRSSNVNNTAARVSDNSTYSGLMHGATPVVGTSWNDVPAQNATDVAIAKYVKQNGSVVSDGTATITLSGVANPYTTTQGSYDGERILFGYCDDGSSPVVTIKNIPFAKYRVIVYASTDDGSGFNYKTINDVNYSTDAAGSSATPTIAGKTGEWGSYNSRAVLAEGVNYLVSDIISDTTTVTINNTRSNNARGGIAAVQIVEVGVEDINTYDINADSTYTIAEMFPSMSGENIYEINVNESATLNVGSAATAGAVVFNVAAGKTLTISGSTITANSIYVNGEGKVACSAANTLSGTIKGDGRIVYTGMLPASALTASFQDGNNWTGTVEIKNYNETTDRYGIIKFNLYGNINSAIALNGVTSTIYTGNSTYPDVTLRELEIGEDGWTDKGDTYSISPTYKANLTGHGLITIKTGNDGDYSVKFIGNHHTFDGSIAFGDSAGKQVAFMKADSDTLPSVTAKAIFVADGVNMSIASGESWTAPGGISVCGTLKADGSAPISGSVAVFETGTLDISGFTGATPAIPGALTLNGGVIKLPAGAELPYRIAASGDGAPEYYTIGTGEPLTGALLKNGQLVATRTATISSEIEVSFGSVQWTGTGNDYTLTVDANTYLTFDSTIVNSLKIIVEDNGALFVKGEMPENTTIIGLTPLTIVVDATETFKAGYTRLYSQIGTTENGNGALNVGGAISVTSVDAIQAGSYTLARWLKPQKMSTGYGSVGTLTANTGTLSKELVYCADSIALRVWDETTQSAKPTLKIMPYGDSITEGYNNGKTKANYRVLLAQKLSLAGYNVKMVGAFDKIQTDNGNPDSMADAIDPAGNTIPEDWKWHSAKHGGTVGVTSLTTYQRSAMVENVDTLCAQAGTPDAVLLLGGINDLSPEYETPASVFANWKVVVGKLVSNLPNTKILVATTLHASPARTDALNTNADSFNTLVKNYMKDEMPDEWDGHVYLVDLCDAVKSADEGTITTDNLHPDWWGHNQMAQAWFEKITELYPDPSGTFPSSNAKTAPASGELGAANKAELAPYRAGFTRYGVIEVGNNKSISPVAYTEVNNNAPVQNIIKVGYFVEYVRNDNNEHRWVWVDMDAFGSTIGDVGLPTANHQQVVTKLHVRSNHPGIENVAADNDSVTGWIEFTPFDYTGNSSGVSGAPLRHGAATGSYTMFDWDDTLSTSEANVDSGANACMQVFRKAPATGRPAQTLFAFNNWRSTTGAAEFGIGNFSQHFWGGQQTFDYTYTRGLEKMNAGAYSVKRIEIWTRSASGFMLLAY